MAQESPSSIDVQDVQFKRHDNFCLFNAAADQRSHVDLLATASSQGLLFAGNPNAPEIKVIILKELVEAKTTGQRLRVRSVSLPSVPNALACSADGSMLAINYTLNGSGFLQIYNVASFTMPNVKSLYSIRLSPEEHVFALQLLWNPVLTANLAVVLSNGALGMYTLKEGGHFEQHTLERTNQVRCGSWSPKGKQIVLGFPQGKLQQFKPDLTPAKTISCPASVHPGPFDTIALHWLSTFQFAAVFLQHGEETSPSLYIVNAPKGGTPTYINYYDICYSASGPRAHQLSFTHIQPWNLLLMTSANGVEVGLLGTKEAGETPTWLQYALLDEARIEMPLTEAKDETYPIGFVFDTSASHQLTIGEVKMPVSPMVHVLSTHGHLISFDFLNLSPGAVGICSPPPPLTDTSGQFRSLEEFDAPASSVAKAQEPTTAQTAGGDMSFAFAPSAVTSTPAVKDKAPSMFGAFSVPTAAPISTLPSGNMLGQGAAGVNFSAPVAAKAAQPSLVNFGLAATTAPSVPLFGASVNATTTSANSTGGFGGFGSLAGAGGGTATFATFEAKQTEVGSAAPISAGPAQGKPQQQQVTVTQKPNELNKPLYTVPATFTPPAPTATHQQTRLSAVVTAKPQLNSGEINEVVKQMIAVQINAFDSELKQLANHSKGLLANIGNPNEMRGGTKRLNDLQEIIEQANDRDFDMDVQNLRHSLNESYSMLAECRSKLEMYNNPDITRLTSISTFDPINRRQLAKLQSYLAANQVQLQQLQQQIDNQWSGYQDLVRRNSRTQMHIPCLDGIYQRMTKLKDVVARQRTKLNYIKSKLKQKGFNYQPSQGNCVEASTKSGRPETSMESLADSILSMSMVHVVDSHRSKMSDAKLNAIRNFTRQQQQITIIKPQRPDRVDLKSEVILETKLQGERKARSGATTSLAKMHSKTQQVQQTASSLESSHVPQLAKPMATKPTIVPVQPQTTFAPPAQAQMGAAPSFNLGGTSLFVKTSSSSSTAAATAGVTNKIAAEEQTQKPFSIGSSFPTPTFTGFGSGAASFAALTAVNATKTASTAPPTIVDKENKKSEEAPPKAFSFQPEISTSGPAAFGGFGGGAAATATNTKTSSFGSDGSSFSFGGSYEATGTSSTAAPVPPAFSFGGAVSATSSTAVPTNAISSITAPVSAAVAKPPVFSGFGKPIGETNATKTLAPVTTSTSSGFSFGGAINLSTAPQVVPSAATSTETAVTKTTTEALASSTSDQTDQLFGTLNICKPNTTKNSAAGDGVKTTAGNAFAGFGDGSAFSFTSAGAGGGDTSIFAAPSGNTGSSFSFGAASTSFGKAVSTSASTAATATITNPTTAVAVSAISTSTTTTAAATSAVAPTSATFSFAAMAGLGGAVTAATSSTATTATPAPTSIFGGGQTSLAATTTAAATSVANPVSAASTSIFGSSGPFAASTSSAPASAATGSIFANAATTPSSVFSSVATAQPSTALAGSGTNIFGGGGAMPKPDQSVFGSPSATSVPSGGVGLFAAAAAASSLPFGGSPTSASAASGIFGGGGATAASSGGSIFGGGATSATSPFGAAAAAPNVAGASMFAKPVEGGGGLFGGPAAVAGTSSGGSIFGQSTFGATPQISGGTNIFAAAQSNAATGTGFGGASSVFGGASSGGSIFGGATAPAFGGATASGGGGFGAFSQSAAPSAPGFGSPNAAAAGGFAQGGVSIAQSGFGSSQQPVTATSAFTKPLFGSGGAAFGSPPSFGAQPSFGGAPTFGSPKPFGSFVSPNAAVPQPSAFGSPPTQKNNLFEALGSNESGGLSFGNLAQNTNVNAPKPTFGGSSFMNYRA